MKILMLQTQINDLPNLPGVYKFFNAKHEVIYVGKAKNLKKRVSSYFSKQSHDSKTLELVKNIFELDTIITKDEYSALILENELIKEFWPKYNIALKDDKNYPFIITNKKHAYPRFDYFAGKKQKGNEYLGPYTDKNAIKTMLREIQKLFLIRSCTDHQFNQHKACLLYQIKRCSAPCEQKQSPESYQEQYKEALMFLKGKHYKLQEKWQAEMQAAAAAQNYEKAANFRDLIKRSHKLSGKNNSNDSLDVVVLANKDEQAYLLWLWVRDGMLKGKQEFKIRNPIAEPKDHVLETLVIQILTSMPSKFGIPNRILVDLPEARWSNVQLVTGMNIKQENPKNPRMQKWLDLGQQNLAQTLKKIDIKWGETIFNDQELQQILQLAKPPKHTECFDVSHTSGKQVYASCVVFDENGPNKKLYRTYKIPFDDKPDDYLALNYVFNKRYQDIKQVPDLIIVDGGKGQLNILLSALKSTICADVPVLAISKGPSRKEGGELLHSREFKDYKVSQFNQALYALLYIRNESHRFALRQHRKAREKHSICFKIENVPGISSKKRQELYSYFGGLSGLRSASIQEIAKVKGIGPKLAQKIQEFLNDN